MSSIESPPSPTPAPPDARADSPLVARLFAPVDIAPLVWFRIAFGIIMMWQVWRYFESGWIHRYYVDPTFHFTYFGFGWVHPWSARGMEAHFLVVGLLALAMTLGLFYRVTATLFFFAFTYIFLLDQTEHLNHLYLVCLFSFLLIFTPANRACSIDAVRRPQIISPTMPTWVLWILRAQICIVYFFGGVAKLNSDWLHGEPMRMWLRDRTEFPLIGRFFHEEWMVYAFTYGGLLFDLFIPALLLWRRTRLLAFGLTAFFNLTNWRLFNIGIFPWLALGTTVILFSSDWLPRPWPKLWRKPAAGPDPETAPAQVLTRHQRITAGLLAAWLAFQILMPLRHLFLYPGNPEWTEEGHRFSWRMKLRSKEGNLKFTARNTATGKTWDVRIRDYLTDRQRYRSADRPDMILQLAHHIARDLSAKNDARIEIFARSMATLNGRPMQVLIDPKVDLAAQPRSLASSRWIMPLTTPLRAGLDVDDDTK